MLISSLFLYSDTLRPRDIIKKSFVIILSRHLSLTRAKDL